MIRKTSILLLHVLISILSNGQNDYAPEINVVYGEKHIFTIETPKNWINDRDYAKKVGLVCFFHPMDDTTKNHINYFFANGIDKYSPSENLSDYISDDLIKLKGKYPEMIFDTIPIGISGGLKNAILYSFSNLSDRFKEEVLYSETDDSFIILSFSAMTTEDYIKYQPVFDTFISSLHYRGNNPKPFLEYMKNQDQ